MLVDDCCGMEKVARNGRESCFALRLAQVLVAPQTHLSDRLPHQLQPSFLLLLLSVVRHPGSFLHTKVPPTLSIDGVHDRAYFRRGGRAAGGRKGVQHAPA